MSPSQVGNGEPRVGAQVSGSHQCSLLSAIWPSVFMALMWFYLHHAGEKTDSKREPLFVPSAGRK